MVLRQEQGRLVLSCVVVFLTTTSLFLYIPELPALLLRSGAKGLLPAPTSTAARHQIYALAMSMPQVCSALGAPILGALSDRWGRKRILMVALAGVLVSMLLCAGSITLHQPVVLLAGLAAIGLMDGSGVIVQAGLIEGQPAEVQADSISKLTASGILGIVAGPLVGGLFSDSRLFSFAGYAVPFVLDATLFGIVFCAVAFFYEERGFSAEREAQAGPNWLMELAGTLRSGAARWYLLLFFLMEIVLACFYERVPMLLEQHGASTAVTGLYGGYTGILMVLVCVLLVPRIPDGVGTGPPLAAAFGLLLSVGVLLLGQPEGPRLWLAGIPFAAGAATIFCLTMAKMAEGVAAHQQGKIAGIATWASGVAFVVAGLVVSNRSVLSSGGFPVVIGTIAALGIGVTLYSHKPRGWQRAASPIAISSQDRISS